ncbi:MAG: DEAD/DEAH box helicase [Planctomycetota bacterium]
MSPTRIAVDFHEGTLRITGLSSAEAQELSTLVPFVEDHRDACLRSDAMHASRLKHWLTQVRPRSFEWRIESAPVLHMSGQRRRFALREDQERAVTAFESGGCRGLIQMPTGTGKTVVAIDLIRRFATSTLVVVPVRDLMYQWHDRIVDQLGVDAGLIGDGVHRVSPVSVTTYDSAAIHMPRLGDRFDMLVFDEVHHLTGPWRRDAARMSLASVRLGLSATLPTDSNRLATLHELVGPTLYEQSINQAAGHTLADYHVRRIAVKLAPEEQRRYDELSRQVQRFVADRRDHEPHYQWEETFHLAGSHDVDPEVAQQADAALRASRMKRSLEEHAAAKVRVLEDLFRLHAGEPMIVFTGSNVMARKLSLRFLVPCLLSHCAKKERREYLNGFAAGRFPVLIANRVLDEGVDLPQVKTAIVMGGMSSSRQAIQRLGRVLRRTQDDRKAVLYEIVAEGTKEVMRSRDRRRNDAYRKRQDGKRVSEGR